MGITRGLIMNEKVLLEEGVVGPVGVFRRTTRLRIYRFNNNYGMYVKFDKRKKAYDIKIIKYVSDFNTPVHVLKEEDINELKIKGYTSMAGLQTVLSLLEQVEYLEFAKYSIGKCNTTTATKLFIYSGVKNREEIE